MPDERCETCRFWLLASGNDNKTLGQCRRNPPTLAGNFNHPDHAWPKCVWLKTAFPITGRDEWCGEYQPADNQT